MRKYSAYTQGKRDVQDAEEKAFLEQELKKNGYSAWHTALNLGVDRPNLLRLFRRLKVKRWPKKISSSS